MEAVRLGVEAQDAVAFAKNEVERAGGIEVDGAGAVNRGVDAGRAFRCSGCDSCSSEGGDASVLHHADAVIADVADEEAALGIESEAMGLTELRVGRGTAVACVAGGSRTCDDGDLAGFEIQRAHLVGRHVDKIEDALGVEAKIVGFVLAIQYGGELGRF